MTRESNVQIDIALLNRLHCRRTRLGAKAFVLELYGEGKCLCCGASESDFLLLDHCLDNGNHERRETGNRGMFVTLRKLFLKQRIIRADLQVLCSSCSLSKKLRHGTCIHAPHRSLRVLRTRRADAVAAFMRSEEAKFLFDRESGYSGRVLGRG
jgi:hypothetical protein